MHPFHAIILGIVEGLTEFLPVSSTGHLMLASRLLQLQQTEFLKTFDIAIQVGAIAAVVVLHWRDFLHWPTLKRVAAAFVPTAIVGLLVHKVAKQYLFDNVATVLWAMFIGGAVLIEFERWYAKRATRTQAAAGAAAAAGAQAATGPAPEHDVAAMSYKQAAIIGLAQCIAIIPGVSRSAASILGGLALGLRRETVVRFSFLLAVPTIGAAAGLDLFKSRGNFLGDEYLALAIGTAVSFVVALSAIKYFLKFVRTNTFVPFGWYRIIAAIAFFLILR